MKNLFKTITLLILAMMLFIVPVSASETSIEETVAESTEPQAAEAQQTSVTTSDSVAVTEEKATVTTNEPIATDSKQEWQIYLEEKVIPAVIFVATSAGSVLLMLAPAIKAAKKTIVAVKQASDDVSGDKNATKAAQEALKQQQEEFLSQVKAFFEEQKTKDAERELQLKALQEENQKYRQALSDTEARLALSIQRCATSAENTRKMVHIAFTNNNELIQKGAARRIAEVNYEDQV